MSLGIAFDNTAPVEMVPDLLDGASPSKSRLSQATTSVPRRRQPDLPLPRIVQLALELLQARQYPMERLSELQVDAKDTELDLKLGGRTVARMSAKNSGQLRLWMTAGAPGARVREIQGSRGSPELQMPRQDYAFTTPDAGVAAQALAKAIEVQGEQLITKRLVAEGLMESLMTSYAAFNRNGGTLLDTVGRDTKSFTSFLAVADGHTLPFVAGTVMHKDDRCAVLSCSTTGVYVALPFDTVPQARGLELFDTVATSIDKAQAERANADRRECLVFRPVSREKARDMHYVLAGHSDAPLRAARDTILRSFQLDKAWAPVGAQKTLAATPQALDKSPRRGWRYGTQAEAQAWQNLAGPAELVAKVKGNQAFAELLEDKLFGAEQVAARTVSRGGAPVLQVAARFKDSRGKESLEVTCYSPAGQPLALQQGPLHRSGYSPEMLREVLARTAMPLTAADRPLAPVLATSGLDVSAKETAREVSQPRAQPAQKPKQRAAAGLAL